MFRLRYLTYPIQTPVTLYIDPVFPNMAREDVDYALEIVPFGGLRARGKAPIAPEIRGYFYGKQPLKVEKGALVMGLTLPQEDSYAVRLYAEGVQILDTEIYALAPDLFPLTPYKGDQHLHSWMSDGKDSPMYMAACACRRGYDYCAITDHRRWEPSLLTRDFYAQTAVDFLVMPGEEVHSPDNPVHILSLGARESVNDWWRDHEDEYRAAVEERLPQVDADMNPEDRYACAASQVMFDYIREKGGLSVLCHPHWMRRRVLHQTEDITDYLVENKRFDALELVAGGAYEDGMQLQLSYYHGVEKMPILGNSDAHGCYGEELEPGNFTIVFAQELSVEGVKAAILQGLAIGGNGYKLYGDYRLVKYGYFLLRHYYPEHLAQRNKLGALMQRMASAQQAATDDMKAALATPRPSELFEGRRYR